MTAPGALAGGSGANFGSNGQHRRPFYNFGHNPNTLAEAANDLAAGANALEPDVMHFSDATFDPSGTLVNSYAGESGLFMYHDHTIAPTRPPTTVEDWLEFVHQKVLSGSNVAMIAFDIKSAAAQASFGANLLQAVHRHLNYGGVHVNVIFSVASRDDGAVFDNIIGQLGPREGVMIDAENDPGSVYNYFVGRGAAGHIGYGNGAIGFRYGFAPHVLTGIEAASWIRAGQVPDLAVTYAYPMDLTSDMHALITAGADGEIPDFDSPVASESDTLEHIGRLAQIVNERDDIYAATAAEDPFHPRVEAYGLRVDTKDEFGAGTNSNITFTLTGCNGTSSVTVDTSFRLHMESGDRNYVTLPSKDLGSLETLTLSSDGSGLGSQWDPGRIEISSANYGLPYDDHLGAVMGGSVNDDSPQTVTLGGWGHRCDPGIDAQASAFAPTEGVDFSGEVASFTDPDPAATASEYAATINWGDGTSTSAGTVRGPVNGRFTVSGSHPYAEEGHQVAVVTIRETETDVIHEGANPVNVFAGTTVADAPLTADRSPVIATEGATFSGTLASFSDADPAGTLSDYSATIDWGDGSSSTGTVSAAGLSYNVTGTHTYPEEGSYPVTTKVTDAGGATATTDATATVTDAALAATGKTVVATEGASFSGQVAALTDADPAGTVSDYSVSIDWGDGSSSTGSVSSDGPSFAVAGTHTYAEEGRYDVTVNIADAGGSTTTADAKATVADAPLAATALPVGATEGAPFTAKVATFTDADPAGTASDYAATINWGDGSSSTGGVSVSGIAFAVAGTHTYAEEGRYTVTTKVTDAGGSTATDNATASVADATLAATGKTVYTTNPVTNVPIASFTDADPAGTVSDYTATVDFNDGSAPSSGTVTGPDGGPFTVAASHSYAPTGPFNFNVTLHVCDVGGSCADTTSLVKLLYMTGHSIALQSKLTLPLLPADSRIVSDTGDVANTGATATSRSQASTPSGLVTASALNASLQTTVGKSVATSSVARLSVNALLIPAIVIQGVSSTSTSTCAGSTGSTQIGSLSIGGVLVATSGVQPNTTINLGVVKAVLNEQTSVDGGLEVNAVHLTIPGVLNLVVSSSRSDIHNCPR